MRDAGGTGRRGHRVLVMAVAVAVVAAVAAPPVSADVAVLVVRGKGFGHGVGMAQDGAYWMGVDGASTEQILGHFYPGTQMATGKGPIRVALLAAADGETVVRFPQGGEVRSPLSGQQSPGFPIKVQPNGAVRLRFDGTYHGEPLDGATASARAAGPAVLAQLPPLPTSTTRPGGTTTTTSPLVTLPRTTTTTRPAPKPTTSTITTTTTRPGDTTTTSTTTGGAPPPPPPDPGAPTSASPLYAVPSSNGTVAVPDKGARYRGYIEASNGPGGLRLVNQVDVEDYLRGMGEVGAVLKWPQSSLGVQAVAARTYALRAMAAAGEICDSERCQVYLGQQVEYEAMDKAVAATRGEVLAYHGALASTVFSASAGGVSATTEEGFGTPGAAYPYLQSHVYTTRDPQPFEVSIALADLGRRLAYPGDVQGVRVAATGPSGRPTVVELNGTAGAVQVPALRFNAAVGLRSTLWSVAVEQAAVAPTPPPTADDAPVQALPEQVGAAVAEELAQSAAGTVERPHARAPVVGGLQHLPGGRSGPGAPAAVAAVLIAAVLAAGAVGARTLRRARAPE